MIHREHKRGGILGSLRGRDLRMEQFEDRVLLSITPPAGLDDLDSIVCDMDQYEYLSDNLSQAVYHASDLSAYEESQLEITTQWVVGVDDAVDAPQLAASLGADFLASSPYLERATIWEFSDSTSWVTVADTLQHAENVDYFYPLVPREAATDAVPNDSLFANQWHLQNTGQSGGSAGIDANVVLAWDEVTGEGVVIGIVDDGLELDHPDLVANVRADLSYDFNNNDNDPSPVDASDNHGTSVAGVAGAVGNNGLGVSGAAPDAELAGLRTIAGWPTDWTVASALGHESQEIDIYNNSWGWTTWLAQEGPLTLAAIEDGVTNGRDGLGSIYVFSAGNDRWSGENVNWNTPKNLRTTIAVAAIDHDGHFSSYSSPGAPVLISAYSSSDYSEITTTDRTGDDGYNMAGGGDGDPLDPNYTSTFGGTSSAAPLVSGIIALILEANPELTYRDVQYILVESAEINDSADYDWSQNGAGYWVNHNYGFGAVDAAAAVTLASDWENVSEELSLESNTVYVNDPIPDGSPTGIASSVTLDDSVEHIEWVEVTFDASHASPGDLEVILISPDGTESRLAESTSNWWTFEGDYNHWTFSSCHHWGESSEGEWTLEVRDYTSGSAGTFNSWELRVYGTSEYVNPGDDPNVVTKVGPELVSISPNEGGTINSSTILNIAPQELKLLFNEQQVIDPATLSAIRMVRAGGDGVIGNANDVPIEFGWIGIGDRPNEVLVRFAETLPDDMYQITIIGEGEEGDIVLTNIEGGVFHGGEDVSITFELELGAQVTAVVPQPTYRDAGGNLQQDRDVIEVYFNDDELKEDSAERPEFYRLCTTGETATPDDDVAFFPTSVVYDPVNNKATLTFADDLANLGTGSFRLRIGNEYRQIPTSTQEEGIVGDTLGTATDLGALGTSTEGMSLIVSSSIEPLPYDLQWPGSIEELGHRETLPDGLLSEAHLGAAYNAADTQYGATTIYYRFPTDFGVLPSGSPAGNFISAKQKERAREIFELFGANLGVQFIEDTTAERGLIIATGDPQGVDPSVIGGIGSPFALATGGVLCLDNAEPWEDGYGESWFQTAMHGIGLLLGLGYTSDLPAISTMNANADPFDPELVVGDPDYYELTAEDVFPGNHDLIHGRHVYRPDGTDTDLYKLELEAPGTFSAEVTAERLENASLLDSVLTVYSADGTMIARNDDYYSDDSYIELSLDAGVYYVAISSTGNVEFDADVTESGLGGVTQGDYDLRFTYHPDLEETGAGDVHLVDMDTTKTLFDGDADGVPGGVHNFWFNVQAEADTLFVYKYEEADRLAGKIVIQDTQPLGSLANPYRNIDDALAAAGPDTIVRILGNRDRTYDAHEVFDVNVDPSDTAVGDIDNDGAMDIVATNSADDSVSILFGLGDGTYWDDVTYDVGDQPGAVTLGDVDNDGDLDIVVANEADNTISFLLNDGTGAFNTEITRFSGANPSDLALGDVNDDGILDVVIANRNDGTIGVLPSVEPGVYTDQQVFFVGQWPVAVDLGDLDNDGMLDIVAANEGDGTVSILINDGEGDFAEPGDFTPIRPLVGSNPSSVVIADLDGDGNRDVVVANSGSDNVSVLLGSGDGLFADQATYSAGEAPSSVGVADLDQDGALDVVTANRATDNVSVFFGIGDGTFETPVFYETGDQPMGMTLADMDGDNRPDIITANHGSAVDDGDAVSLLLARRDEAYLIGHDRYTNPLEDGSKMEVPQGVTVMIDAGAVIKLRGANIDVGSSTLHIDRSLGALQVLGTPEASVYITSYHDKSLGSWETDQAEFDLVPFGGDWGGLVFRNEMDYDDGRTVLETEGIFLNYVNHAEIRYGGGTVYVDGQPDPYAPLYMIEARPTISNNTILHAAGGAMSADPHSFADTKFQGEDYTANYDRVGPEIHGNTLLQNSQNGIFVRIDTLAGDVLKNLEVPARFDDRDIVHLLKENLLIAGTPGGPTYDGNDEGTLTSRLDARLTIDPGIIVKLAGSRIEAEVSAQLIAEGTKAYPIIFTALSDDSYGAGGTFDTNDDDHGADVEPTPGEWGGLYFAPSSSGSIDHAYIAYGGAGATRIPGTFADFNAIEIHQASVRLTNSVLAHNTGAEEIERPGWPTTTPAVIFVRGAQPVIAGNVIRDNEVAAISMNANSLVATQMVDQGRSTGQLDAFEEYPDNHGPLVRDNHLANNGINGMVVRGEVLSIDSVWDDTDIVHVVYDEILVPNFHTYGGLRLQSAIDESLVVKFSGSEAGLTALGTPGEIEDRIGGTLQIVGAAGFPVVLTSLADDSIGAGLDPWGRSQQDTDNTDDEPFAGDWRSIKLEEYVNDRNVAVVLETESAHGDSIDNDYPIHAQTLGELASSEKSSDDNLRLGFDVHGFIRADEPGDVDVYSFTGRAGTEVWIDIDRTSLGLDSIVELIDANGNVIARSDNSPSEEINLTQPYGIAHTMNRDVWDTQCDMYTTNVHDAGMRLVLPGASGTPLDYYIRVRSADADGDGIGDSVGGYQLQVRLREEQEIAGSTVLNSSIRYATHGIELLGLPTSSPLVTEAAEIEGKVVTTTGTYATADASVDGDNNDFRVTATTVGPALNDVWVVFVDGGQTGDVAEATYDPAYDNGGTTIKVILISGDPDATTANTVVAAINAEGTFSAELIPNDGGANDGTGLISPVSTQLGLTAGGTTGSTDTSSNDTFETAEHLGNLLDSNYGSIEVSGFLTADEATGEYDIDWYSFELDPQKLFEDTGTNVWSLVFDIDYADGMSRADTVIYVFDAEQRLIYMSDNSNIDEDQRDPLGLAGGEDLTRGSAGTGDPYLGPVAMLDTDTTDPVMYYVAVASKARYAEALAMNGDEDNPALNQPLLRVEPINSIVKIAEDNIGDANGDMVADTNASGTAGSPDYVLFPDINSTELSIHVDDYHLNDVVMYVCMGTDVYTFNPFTGEYHLDLTGSNSGAHSPDTQDLLDGATGLTRYDDIVMRNDGKLYTMTWYNGNSPADMGRTRQISTGDGSVLSDVDDGIQTYLPDPADVEAVIADDVGIHFRAMIDVVESGTRYTYAVGGPDAATQYLFKFDQDGNVVSPGGSVAALPTSRLPWRQLMSFQGLVTGLDFCDGSLYAITDAGMLYKLEGYASEPSDVEILGAESDDGMPPTWSAGNWLIDVALSPDVYDLTAMFQNQYPSLAGPIAFSGMTAGPQNVELGAYTNTLFATDSAGGFYAFQWDPGASDFVPASVFLDGHSMITLGQFNMLTGAMDPMAGATGVAFSTLDYNLWHITQNRYQDDGHQINVGPDDTRPDWLGYPSGGNFSFWFGLENSNSFQHPGVQNYMDDNSEVISTYDLPGGAHGALTTSAFSLAGYESQDSPVLTFEYYLETDGTDTNVVTDSARVYISNDGVDWALLATNINTPDDVMGTSDDSNPPPVYLQDGTGGWLQASVNLAGYVGMDNLRLKFEFNTAGSTNVSSAPSENMYTGHYLRSVAGSELIDGDMFSMILDQSMAGSMVETIFEFDMGYSLLMPNSAGRAIPDGETLTITDDQGREVTFEFDKDGQVSAVDNVPISISDSDSSNEVARLVGLAFNIFYEDAVAIVAGDRVYLSRMEVDPFTGIPIEPIVWHGATEVTQSADPVITLEGNAPGERNDPLLPDTVLVPVDGSLSASAVAFQISRAIDQGYVDDTAGVNPNANNDGTLLNADLFTSVKCNDDLIYVMKHVIASPGKLYAYDALPGELPTAGGEGSDTTQFYFNTQGQDNAYEGWYVDNVTIGFVERGQMVTAAEPNAEFGTLDAQDVSALQVNTEGPYQLEIRLASEYSVWDPMFGTINTKGFDTNDRHAEDITLLAPAAGDLVHLSTFTVEDGLNSQTFRFVDPAQEFDPIDGVIDIYFLAGRRADQMAQSITSAINSATTIDVTASNVAVGNVGSDRVVLDGATDVVGLDHMVYDHEGEYPTDIELFDTIPDDDEDFVDLIVVPNQYTGTVTVITSGTKYEVGDRPSAVEVEDLNGDGVYDIVVSNAGDHTVSVLLGNATGSYEDQLVFGTGTEPTNVELYDLDADGRIDIITTNKTDGSISILYGNGDGTFRTARNIPIGWAPMSVVAGDLNGDGIGDLAVANSRDNTVAVLLSVHDTVYAAPVTYGVGRLPLDVELADMNNDEVPDLLTANRVDGTVSLLLGNGDGTFADTVDYFAGLEPVDLDIADLDMDEDLDVVTSNYSDGTVSVLLGTGTSEDTLGAPSFFSAGLGPLGVAIGDYDMDYIPDIFTADHLSHSITFLAGAFGYLLPSSAGTGDSLFRRVDGDDNTERAQGQVIISGNEILYAAGYGIRYDAGERDSWSHPGAVAPLVKVSPDETIPSVTIENNLIVAAGLSGILFSGDSNDADGGFVSEAAVPFGRIVNNTIYGGSAPLELLEPGDVIMEPNDDESSDLLPIGFELNFYGNTYTEMYVNNNGNITFDEALWDFVPEGFPQNTPIIAPFWADIDTRGGGEVRLARGTSATGNAVVQIDWIDCGYFAIHGDKTNTFTLYIEDDPAGDIVVFVYHDMQWTTGDIDGWGGFGGEGAQTGFDAGDGTNYVSVARPNSLRDLEDLMDPGIYVWRLSPDSGVPFAGGGTGIQVMNNASPTILNNVVANLETGISVDDTCPTTVIGANAYHNNGLNTAGIAPSDTALLLDPSEPLFVDPENGNFYPAAGSRIIDSSIDSLEDRKNMTEIREPLGIAASPILAPDADLFGQLRGDDPDAQPPSGVGDNVFKDRGAIDRVDFSAPMATIISPVDNDLMMELDQDPAPNDVFVLDQDVTVFAIQLADTVGGIGIDDHTVTPSTVQIFKDGSEIPLQLGKDYFFDYDSGTDIITLIAGAGLWKRASEYTIVLDNGPDGIRDIAGNQLRPNRLDQTTRFYVSIQDIDFGDAPDFPDEPGVDYPTRLASNGASHLLIGDYYLGQGVSGETDANFTYDEDTKQYVKDASGDTMDDGVTFTSALLVGAEVTLDVEASASDGYLYAWVDLNADGDFDDDGEQVITKERLSSGWNSLTFDLPDVGEVPYTIVFGETFVRFRYVGFDDADPDGPTNGAALGSTGQVPTGEVEDYQVVLVDTLKDFGDAPNPYPTLLEDNGAVHNLTSELVLGSIVDQELDGQPHLYAKGDDNHGMIDNTGEEPVVIDDEDGVNFVDYLKPGATVDVVVTASAAGGLLNAWIDFNADGDWDDAGEQIADGVALAAGENTIEFTVPGDAVEGKTFARFRLSTEADLDPTGMAPDGEVEDYQILVTANPRDFGDAPRTYSTVRDSEQATAHLILDGKDNDMLLTAVEPGTEMNNVDIVIDDGVFTNVAIVEYDDVAKRLTIRIDPAETTAATVVAAINAEVDTIFTAELSDLVDEDNDGSGLLPTTGLVAKTTNGQDGSGEDTAYHDLTSNLYLGEGVDPEMDGQPNDDALGDDEFDLDDEDGVEIPDVFIAGTTKTLDIKVHLGDVDTAYLSAWIDFNIDGVFSEDEQVIYGDAITSADLDGDGMYSSTVLVPITAVSGDTYARFRLSTDPDLSFDGFAADGEVEDYQVVVGHGTGSISGWVFEDRDRDGQFDSREDGISGVIVYIDSATGGEIGKFDWEDKNDNGEFDPGIDRAFEPFFISMEDDLTTSGDDETGYYAFDGLAGRSTPYRIRFDTTSLEGWDTTYPDHTVFFPDGSHGNDDHSYTIFLEEAESIEEANFGNYRLPSVTVDDVKIVEKDEGFTEVEVTLTLHDSFGAPVEVQFETADGTAFISDGDYVSKTGTVEFPQSNPTPTWELHTLTNSASNEYDYGVSGNYVAWEGFDGNDWEIFLFNGVYDEGGVPNVIQLTDNDIDDNFASLFDTGSGVNVAWVASDGHDAELFLYNGGVNLDGSPKIHQITNNFYNDADPRVSGSLVTWWADDGGGDGEIFVLDLEDADVVNELGKAGTTDVSPYIVNLSDNDEDDRNPVVSGRNVAWTGWRQASGSIEVFAFDGENGDLADPEIDQVTANNSLDQAVDIDGHQIVWEQQSSDSTFEIFTYHIETGQTVQVTDDWDQDRYPQISGDNIVWQGHNGSNWEIYLYNTISQETDNISGNSAYETTPKIEGSQVVWLAYANGDSEVYHYDIDTDVVTNVSQSENPEYSPRVSDAMVIWRTDDGEDFEIIAAERQEPETTETVTLRIIGDQAVEADEYFYLMISADDSEVYVKHNEGYDAGQFTGDPDNSTRAKITILNDDGVLDFGDAPETDYPTTLENDGARHKIDLDLYLGSSVDTEEDGIPTENANGDDIVTSDDEDGITFLALTQGSLGEIEVTVTGFGGFLDGWIDFNADGDWDDAGERIFNAEMVDNGTQSLSFAVPAAAKTGDTYARFRLSETGGLNYTGYASEGEVEDYLVTIAEKPASTTHVVTLAGTDGNDTFEFFAGDTTLAVELNGARFEYPAYVEGNDASVHTILFDGGKGKDTVIFHGTNDDESAELWAERGVFRGPTGTVLTPHDATEGEYFRYLVDTTTVEVLSTDAGGGQDEVVLHDTPADDFFEASAVEVKMNVGSTPVMTATNYSHARAISGNGGIDTVKFTGTAGDDLFKTYPETSQLATRSDEVPLVDADGFDVVVIDGGGNGALGDKAILNGSVGDDILTAKPMESTTFIGPGYNIELTNLRFIEAMVTGSGGVDRAFMFDSNGNDKYTATPLYARMQAFPVDEEPIQITATGFRYTAGTANYSSDSYPNGGDDTATLNDSSGTDTFEAHPDWAKMRSDEFQNRVDQFEKVIANGENGGEDVVELTGSSGDDVVTANANSITLTGDGFSISADDFQHLIAFAGDGNDTAKLVGTDGNDTFYGSPGFSMMTTAEGRTFQVFGFDNVEALGKDGYDRAELHDSAQPDLLVVDKGGPNQDWDEAWAELSNDNIDFRLLALQFEELHVSSSSTGDRKSINQQAADEFHIFQLYGDWDDA